jgi:4a-hydroxytetrahydrobiopterin dehydratase
MSEALTKAELDEVIHRHPNWKFESGKLVREWTFRDFVEAMVFVNRVATLAESVGHHPDIDIRYNRVLLGLVTHDVGGITRRDATMAIRIESELSIG